MAERGEYRGALIHLFRYVLIRLDEQGRLGFYAGKTNREILRSPSLRLSDRIFFVTTNLRRGVHHFSTPEYPLMLDVFKTSRSRLGFALCGVVGFAAISWYLADRRRDTVGLRADVAVSETFSFGLDGNFAYDDYPNSDIGLHRARPIHQQDARRRGRTVRLQGRIRKVVQNVLRVDDL